MASRSPELGIRQKNKNLAKPYQCNVIFFLDLFEDKKWLDLI